MTSLRLPFALLLLAMTGCDDAGSADELAEANRERAADADPAVTAALDDPIMTDPDLGAQDDSRRVRHVDGPAEATYPARSKSNARALSGLGGLVSPPGCESGFLVGDAWAVKLPPAFALYPGGKLIEAAGLDRGRCRARVASFSAAAPAQAILDWYGGRATRAGYSATPQTRGADRILTGSRPRDGASYYLIVSPRAQAREVALITYGGI